MTPSKPKPSGHTRHTVNYLCGCGFLTHSQVKAIDHADFNHHTLTVAGMIKPATPKQKKIKSQTGDINYSGNTNV